MAQANAFTAADSSQQLESGTGSDSAGHSMDQALKAEAAAAVESVLKKSRINKLEKLIICVLHIPTAMLIVIICT